MSGKQTFNVPNNSEGQEFLRLLKKFKAPGHSYRARGRGPRRAPGDNYVSFSRQMSLPHKDAESFAVYMGTKTDTSFAIDTHYEEEQESPNEPLFVGVTNNILLIENEGYSFQAGDFVGISQFRKGHPVYGTYEDDMFGVVVEACGPNENIKVSV